MKLYHNVFILHVISSIRKKPRRGIHSSLDTWKFRAKLRNETRLTYLSIIGILATTLWQELTSPQPNTIGSTQYVVESWIGYRLANSVARSAWKCAFYITTHTRTDRNINWLVPSSATKKFEQSEIKIKEECKQFPIKNSMILLAFYTMFLCILTKSNCKLSWAEFGNFKTIQNKLT
jgi:hypothetical protein